MNEHITEIVIAFTVTKRVEVSKETLKEWNVDRDYDALYEEIVGINFNARHDPGVEEEAVIDYFDSMTRFSVAQINDPEFVKELNTITDEYNVSALKALREKIKDDQE